MNARRTLMAALALTAALATGCRRSEEPAAAADPAEEAAEATPEPRIEPKPSPLPVGRHALTASPPATAADLDRLLNVGFTPDEVLVEVARRGVLRPPDAGERAHILTLPRGERLLDAMEAPGNLLSTSAVDLFARYPAGAPDPARSQASQNFPANQYGYAAQRQQLAEYQQRSSALTQRIALLKKRRTAMQQRGEMTATITIEIDRLEREAAALVPPA